MNQQIKFLIGICLLMASPIVAQEVSINEPSVAALMRFEEIPVSNYTGIPDVSIPFTTLPTRNKNIGMDVALAYHPSSVSAYSQVGDCGMGWSLLAGGIISKTIVTVMPGTPDAEANDFYQFNFMGYYGKFDVGGALITQVRSNSNHVLKITVQQNATTLLIDSFTVYDDEGYKYLFGGIDNTNRNPDHDPDFAYRSAYHLTKIYDNNGKQLVSLKYRDFIPADPDTTDNYKKLDSIYSNGYGKLVFNYSTGTSNVYGGNKMTSVILKDIADNEVKRLVLSYTYDKLDKTEIAYPATSKKDTYLLRYKDIEIADGSESVDMWGYRNITPTCNFFDYLTYSPSPYYSSNGVLEQMVLPTGGSIIYDYESNTYNNYNYGTDEKYHLDETPAQFFYLEDDFYIKENHIITTEDDQDYTSNATHAFGFFPNSGTTAKTFYFNVDADTYYIDGINDPDDSPHPFRPTFTVSGPIIPNVPNAIEMAISPNDNNLNKCLGKGITLPPGNYIIQIHAAGSVTNATGHVLVQSRANSTSPTTYFYGGGIRIKHIGYFDNGDVENDYYRNMAYYNGLDIYPARQKNYNYNLFDKPGFSSGVAVDIYGDPVLYAQRMTDQIGYSNVTVTDTPNNGKTEYTYTTYIDFSDIIPGIAIEDDFRRGLMTKQRVYNTDNELVSSLDLEYGSFDAIVSENHTQLLRTFGWSGVTEKVSKSYFAGITNPLTITENYTYKEDNRQLATSSVINGLGETYTTTYDYDTGNSIFSDNRVSEPKEVKYFKGSSLLSSSKFTYSNILPNNHSYLPVTLASAKGSGTPETITHTNVYDPYSHVLETQPENGIKTSYVWGYNNTLPVAKIENMAYGDIPATLLTDIWTQTNIANNEAMILTKLAALRNHTALAGARVTTYTYKPLIGVSTVTDMNGQKMTYTYDTQNRVQYITDADGNILKENQYNNKTQN